MPILKFLGKAVDFIINIGGFLLNALATFIHWGYKAVEWGILQAPGEYSMEDVLGL